MTNTSKQAIILAGGQGTRLKPYTTLLPKALVPLDDMPVLELVIRQLANAGFTQITLAVGHLAELLEAYFGNGSKWGVKISYARESQPLGTAGPLRTIPDLPEHFLVMNADIVSDIDFEAVFKAHQAIDGNLATIAVHRRTSKIDFGIVEYTADGNADTYPIEGFVEKPIYEHSVSMGIYVFSKAVLEFIPENQFFGFDQLVKTLIAQKQKIHAFPFNGYWLDIGRVDDYETAVNDFQTMKSKLLPPASQANASNKDGARS
jgi:NDP-sugar pyrophosphorylase family protein